MSTVVFRRSVLAFLVLLCTSSNALAQSPRRLLELQPGQPAQPRGSSVAAVRHRAARVDTQALSADRLELTLLDDVPVMARRTSRSHARPGSTVWHRRLEAPRSGRGHARRRRRRARRQRHDGRSHVRELECRWVSRDS